MKVQNIAFFQGITHAFGEKNANDLVYLDLVKIRLQIMLGDFAEKKETFLTIKNTIIQTQKIAFSHAFNQKMPIFVFIYN